MTATDNGKRHVLILGGGYGGLACLRGLGRRLDPARYRLSLVDASPWHTIKTRFHERAVLPGRDLGVRYPLRTLAAASGARFRQDQVVAVDLGARRVEGRGGSHPYDLLVFALGGQINHFGVAGAAEHTVNLQTYEAACEAADRFTALGAGRPGGPRRRVMVVGAGIEGLEVAAMLRQAAPADRCEVTVIERDQAVLARSQCGDAQRRYLVEFLARREIGLRLGAAIRRVTGEGVELESGEAVPADLVYWCAGVRRVDLGGLEPGQPFRVGPTLQSPDHPEAFALGDFATVDSRDEFGNLASAQRAVYHGELAAENLGRHVAGRPLRPARYRPAGEMIGLGDWDGAGNLYGVPVTGLAAAAAKKGNELRYAAELFRDLPGTLLRGALALARGRP